MALSHSRLGDVAHDPPTLLPQHCLLLESETSAEEVSKFRWTRWLRVGEALAFLDFFVTQAFKLLGLFNAFGDRLEAEGLAGLDESMNEHPQS